MLAHVVSDSGSNPLTLVYAPGIDGSGELLLGTAARLEKRFRLIRLRYASGDEGSMVGGGYDELAKSVARVLEEKNVERALVLAESFGVGVALELALDQPGRVAGLALVNGFAYFERRFGLFVSRCIARFDPLFSVGRTFGARWALFAPRAAGQELKLFHALPGYFGKSYRRRLAMIARLDLRARLSEIRCPVALFASDSDRIVPSIRAAEEMARRLPDATLEILPRAGHVVLPLAEEPWVDRLLTLAGRAGLSRHPRPDRFRP